VNAATDDEQAATRTRGPGGRRVTAALVALVVASVAPLFRQDGIASWDTVWAEDGAEFAATVDQGDGIAGMLTPSSGYAHVAPRLLALGLEVVPLSSWSEYLAVAATVASALLALFVYVAARPWIEPAPLRAVLAAFVVAAPAMGYESTANLANIQLPLLFAAVWAVLPCARATRRWTALRAIIVSLAALSSPVLVIAAPLALVGFAGLPRHRHDRLVAVAGAVAAVVQIAVTWTATGRDTAGSDLVDSIPMQFIERVLGSAVLGDRFLIDVLFSEPAAVRFLVVAGISTCVVVGLASGAPRSARRTAGALGVISLVLYASSMVLRSEQFDQRGLGYGSRYAVVPVLLLTSALLVLAAHHRHRLARHACAAYLTLVLISSFFVTVPRSTGPTWDTEIDRAAAACRARPQLTVPVPITPREWSAELSCRAVISENDDS
jgi:hypothetical protein